MKSTRPTGANRSLVDRTRRRIGSVVVDSFFRGLANLGRLAPAARPEAHDVELVSDVPYGPRDDHAHLLDVYVPRGFDAPHPVLLYLHGGGFRILSKDTHWLMGLAFARRGYLVFNVNYRLAPEHPFPAAIRDGCRAYQWVIENAERWGGEPERLVVAGESAGANLATALTISACFERPEPWARDVFDTGITPAATLPACGMLQVSDSGRFIRESSIPRWIADRLEEVTDAYLVPSTFDGPGGLDLADPLVVLERDDTPHRALPPFFVPVGTRDPLLDDTRRLEAALQKRGVECHARYYPGEVHAFHAFLWRRQARQCWREKLDFLEERVGR